MWVKENEMNQGQNQDLGFNLWENRVAIYWKVDNWERVSVPWWLESGIQFGQWGVKMPL